MLLSGGLDGLIRLWDVSERAGHMHQWVCSTLYCQFLHVSLFRFLVSFFCGLMLLVVWRTWHLAQQQPNLEQILKKNICVYVCWYSLTASIGTRSGSAVPRPPLEEGWIIFAKTCLYYLSCLFFCPASVSGDLVFKCLDELLLSAVLCSVSVSDNFAYWNVWVELLLYI